MKRDNTVTSHNEREQSGRSEPVQTLRPSVDIFENAHGIRLYADLPGVSESDLNLEVHDSTLTLEGEVDIEVPTEMKSLYADVRSRRYHRAFTLSSELDSSRIEASLRDGLLSVVIPKREEVRPRKIEIAAG